MAPASHMSHKALLVDVTHNTTVRIDQSIRRLQDQMETSTQWLDDAITTLKRKIVQGTGVSIQQQVKRAKTVAFTKHNGAHLSPIMDNDKENSTNDKENSPNPEADGHARIKPPPSSVKRRVEKMAVKALRGELKSKCLPVKGLKKDLQQRLLEAYSTVERAMSPPKQQQIDNKSVSNKDPTASATVEETFPDSDSVEVVVFEPNEEVPASLDYSHSSKGKIASMRNCVIAPKDKPLATIPSTIKDAKNVAGAKQPASASKTHLVAEPDSAKNPAVPLSVELPLPLASQNPKVGEKKNTIPSLVASMPSRIGGQEQLTSMGLEGKEGDISSPQTDAQDESQSVHDEATSSPGKPDPIPSIAKPRKQGVPKTDPPRAQSPIKRHVQEAIQMLTAKSATKPKLVTTPGKLQVPWLKNKSTQQQCSPAQLLHDRQTDLQPVSQQKQNNAKRDITSMFQIPGLVSLTKHTSISASKANHSEGTEARKARIAAMREKAKQGQQVPTYLASTLSSTKMKTAGATAEKGKGNSATLLALMREKAKTRGLKSIDESDKGFDNGTKATSQTRIDLEVLSSTTSQYSKPVTGKVSNTGGDLGKQRSEDEHKVDSQDIVHTMFKLGGYEQANESDTSSGEEAKPRVGQNKQRSEDEHTDGSQGIVQDMLKTSSCKEANESDASIHHTRTKSTQPSPPIVSNDQDELAMLRPQLRSPLDTYEMSDREGSESDESEEEDDDEDCEPRKKIPGWAQKSNLETALYRQFYGEGRVDPDELFPEVKTCDLNAIFNAKKTRYIKRTSSANWLHDKVTTPEKQSYKRTMGYSKER